MQAVWLKKLLLTFTVTALTTAAALGQTSITDESKRKVKLRVAPVYPELAKRMGVSGKVKIEVVIAPDGHVKSAKVVGGHPLLVQNCSDAAKDWKFQPGPDETSQVVEFEFHGS
jgi:TonB family protein